VKDKIKASVQAIAKVQEGARLKLRVNVGRRLMVTHRWLLCQLSNKQITLIIDSFSDMTDCDVASFKAARTTKMSREDFIMIRLLPLQRQLRCKRFNEEQRPSVLQRSTVRFFEKDSLYRL
jgi:hypothetical protein